MTAATPGQPYAGPVLDAHFHLWSLAGDHYPWLKPEGQLAGSDAFDRLKHDYLLADYRRDVAGEGVVASVHMEAVWDPDDDPVAETRWLESLDHSDHLAERYVAAAPFGVDRTEDVLRRQAAYDRVTGIRQIVAWNPDQSSSMSAVAHQVRDERWQQALPLLQELGLHLDLLIYAWQADEVAEMAADHPGLDVVIDHVGGPVDQTPDGVARWRDGIARLAAEPNVMMKISSVHGYPVEPTQAATSAVVQTVVDAFGPDRAMFASDFPVAGMGLSYHTIFTLYRQSVHLEARDQYALFCGTAARFYGIPDDWSPQHEAPLL